MMDKWQIIKEKCSFENGELIQVAMIDEYIQQLEAEKVAFKAVLKRLYKDYKKSQENYNRSCGEHDGRFSDYSLNYVEELLKEKE